MHLEEMMKTVAITGAEGNIGSRLRKNLAGKYELRLISLKPIPGEEAIVVNIAESMEALIPAFKGAQNKKQEGRQCVGVGKRRNWQANC
jgi:nucleoside-diphosphate-sugar epimerase